MEHGVVGGGGGGGVGKKGIEATGNTQICVTFANIYGVCRAVCPRRFAEDGVARRPSCAGRCDGGVLPNMGLNKSQKHLQKHLRKDIFKASNAPASGHRFERTHPPFSDPPPFRAQCGAWWGGSRDGGGLPKTSPETEPLRTRK